MLNNVPLFGIGVKGRSANVSAQSRVNLYAELHADPETNGISLMPCAGLSTFVNFGSNPSRGAYPKDPVTYLVNGNTLWEVAANGTTTNRGTLLTNGGRVDMVDNGAQMLIVDGTYGYIYTFATTTLTQITDVNFPVCNTCSFINGYFIVQKTASGQFFVSTVYDGTVWPPLNFATAESDPDNLVRVMVDNGMLYLFGEKTTEFWGDSGAADFPFARIGVAGIEWGLAARWSLAKFMDSLIFLRKNRLGSVQVCTVTGSNSQAVSTPELDVQLNSYAGLENATGFSYMVNGHPFYQINFASANVSWEYDGLTKEWHQRQTGASGRHAGEIQVNFLNKPYVTDYASGKLYLIDPSVYTDDGNYIVREFITRHNKSGHRVKVSQLWLDMETGVGLNSGQGFDPKIMLQLSRDGGHTWGPEIWRSMGKIGKFRVRAIWNALGIGRDWLMKFRVTDPVKTVFVAGWASVK